GIQTLTGRLAIGIAAAIAFAGARFADVAMLDWMLGYWPSQSDSAALCCGLGGVFLYPRSPCAPLWALRLPALGLLVAGALFKEIAYVAFAAALLLGFRWGRRFLADWLPVAALGAVVVALRFAALHGQPAYQPNLQAGRFLRLALGPPHARL